MLEHCVASGQLPKTKHVAKVLRMVAVEHAGQPQYMKAVDTVLARLRARGVDVEDERVVAAWEAVHTAQPEEEQQEENTEEKEGEELEAATQGMVRPEARGAMSLLALPAVDLES